MSVDAKRLLDVSASAVGVALLAPLMLAIAAWVVLDSGGPVLFRHRRVGLQGRPINVLKFRTMRHLPGEPGAQVTAADDRRITRAGRILRRTKLDELPQLVNVLRGDMSIVGPRPEVSRYVAYYPPGARDEILSVRPGLTDPATIAFRNEQEILAASADPERTYVEEILPAKIEQYLTYVRGRSFAGDLGILWRTFQAILRWTPTAGHALASRGDGER